MARRKTAPAAQPIDPVSAVPGAEELRIPTPEEIKEMKKGDVETAIKALRGKFGSVDGIKDPQEASNTTEAIRTLNMRLHELNRKEAEQAQKEWKQKVQASQQRIERLKKKKKKLEAESEELGHRADELNPEVAALTEIMKRFEGQQGNLHKQGATLEATKVALGARQKAVLADIKAQKEVALGEEEKRHAAEKARIIEEAATACAILNLEVAIEHEDLGTTGGAHQKALEDLRRKIDLATIRQGKEAEANKKLVEEAETNKKLVEEAEVELEKAQAELEALQQNPPPKPEAKPIIIDAEATEVPEAEELDMAQATIDLDQFVESMLMAERGKIGKLKKGLDTAREQMSGGADVTSMKDFMGRMHGLTLSKMGKALEEANQNLRKLKSPVVVESEIKKYSDQVELVQVAIQEEQAFYDQLIAWLSSDHKSPVPVRQVDRAGGPGPESHPGAEVPSAPPVASAPAAAPAPSTPFPGLTTEGAARVAALMEESGGDDGDGAAADGSLDELDVDDATGENLPTAEGATVRDLLAAAPTEPRLPTLTPAQVKQIKDGLNRPKGNERDNAIETLDSSTPSTEWVEILKLAGQSTDASIRRKVPYYAARLALFLSTNRNLNDVGLHFFREFPNAADHAVANRAAGFLPDLVLAAHFNLRVVVDIVTLYFKKRPGEQEQAPKRVDEKERIFFDLTGDLIGKINDIYRDAQAANRAPSHEDGQTIQYIREFLYHLFETVLASSARADYPETVITAILDTLEADPYCLERKAVCDLPLSNEERIKIMTGRTINIVNDLKDRIAAGVDIGKIRAEFKDRASVLNKEMVWFIGWGELTPQEDQAQSAIIQAIELLNERLEGTAPSIELADVDQLLANVEASSSPERAPAEAELNEDALRASLKEYLEGNNYFPEADRILTAIAQKVVDREEVSAEEKRELERVADFLMRTQKWLQDKETKKGQIRNREVLDLLERALAKWVELNETAEELQVVLFPTIFPTI